MKYPIQKWKRYRKRRRENRQNRKRKPIPRIAVPSFFTLMNLFCGFLSIISVSEGSLYFGAWLIVFAGLFDALDGFMARLSNAASQFGIELDSISDVVSFGVAPGFLLYNFGLNELPFVGIILSALPPLCGAVRLARFNVEAQEARTDFFKGLPTPAQAIMLAAFYLTFYDRLEMFADLKNGINTVLIPVIVLLSFLMVSTIPFDKMPSFDRESIRKYKGRIFLFLFYGIVIVLFQEIGLIIVFSAFVIKGLIVGGITFWQEAFGEEI
ncbi:CDP-diacylglycerol--serine O-phosphatidyltransferase [Aliifodinibius sp. S!AR15-10]|uniref:CDP-diacylglycerol--serine O-phosphatidyltransferase n=1 Tax=Aliifodinibius sp. S!AR15-10 TaxID=2950437 RepID=UPI0028618A40|nr:CDP-diacylglycerol--serine O-phosphatidyltransferase [Aliifodinibius sp. S!AR15-10]MDR8392342.1 CDP-diacylglycerol--serine O-phosphatidyltransferase [Aliifodinibius sp. S!AR15-10]